MNPNRPSHPHRRGFLCTAATFAALLLAGSGAPAAGIVVRDARGVDVTIADSSRIVAIGGAITEIVHDLGLDDRIVGVDTTSTFPASVLRDKPNVGYMRQLSPEGILGLHPSLILTMQGSGPRETMDVLEAAKVPMVLVPETFSEQGILDKITIVGRTLGLDARAACLARKVGDDLERLRRLRSAITKPVRVMFVMSLLNGRAMTAGRNTAANEIIRLAGAVNAVDQYDGYKPITDEAIVAAQPDVVLSIERGDDTLQAAAIYAHPAFAMTAVARNKTFTAMDGLYLLGFGPRTASAARDLAIRLYPDLAAATPATSAPFDCNK